nr:hypothetical protein [Campylobacter majalis]
MQIINTNPKYQTNIMRLRNFLALCNRGYNVIEIAEILGIQTLELGIS